MDTRLVRVILFIFFMKLVFIDVKAQDRVSSAQEVIPLPDNDTQGVAVLSTHPILDPNMPAQKESSPLANSLDENLTAQSIVSGEGQIEQQEEKLISLQLKNADIKTVLQMVARECGLSMAIGDFVQGKISLNFTNVTLDEALNAILKMSGYDYVKDGKIYRIVRYVQPVENVEVRTATKIFKLSNIDANSAKEAITPLLSRNGNVQVFTRGFGVGSEKTGQRSDTLVVIDVPENIETIEKVIEKLDIPVGQVLIEAVLMEVSLDNDFDLGINWGVEASISGSALPTTFPLPNRRRYFDDLVPRPSDDNTEFPANKHFPYSESDDFSFGRLSFADTDAVFKALKSKGTANLLSSPRLVTLDNQEARIVIGDVIPIPTYAYNQEHGTWEITGFSQTEIGITLSVTPHIVNNEYIIMQVTPEVNDFSRWVKGPSGEDERPIVSTRKVETQVKIKNGETVVIGGLLKKKKDQTIIKVPIIGDIPLVGLLFTRKDTKEDKKTDLLIFITSQIITENNIRESSQEEKMRMEKSLKLINFDGPAELKRKR